MPMKSTHPKKCSPEIAQMKREALCGTVRKRMIPVQVFELKDPILWIREKKVSDFGEREREKECGQRGAGAGGGSGGEMDGVWEAGSENIRTQRVT